MNILIAQEQILVLVLIFARISVFFTLLPIINFIKLPVVIRILLAVAFSVLIKYSLNFPLVHKDLNALYLFKVVKEASVGAIMAFGVLTVFSIFQLAGRILDFQMGLSVASQIDPISKAQSPMIGALLFYLGSIVFMLEGGLHVFVKVLFKSFEWVSLDQMGYALPVEAMIMLFGLVFSLALVLAAPIIITLFLIDIALSFSARFMPQMNIFILSIPVKIYIGFVLLAISVLWMSPMLQRIYQALFGYWQVVLNG